MKNKIAYVILSLLLNSTYITSMESPLTASQDDIHTALEALKNDDNLKKSGEFTGSSKEVLSKILAVNQSVPHNSPDQSPHRQKRKDIVFNGHFASNPSSELKCYPGKGHAIENNMYNITYQQEDNTTKEIRVTATETYNHQSHVIIAGNDDKEAFAIALNQSLPQDTIRYPHIRFPKKDLDLNKNPCFRTTRFEKNENTYDISYIDENKNPQQISVPCARDYNNESFAIITMEKGKFVFLQLKAEEKLQEITDPATTPNSSLEQPQIIETSLEPQIQTPQEQPITTSPDQTEIEKQEKEEALEAAQEAFKEILKEEREKEQQTSSSSSESSIEEQFKQLQKQLSEEQKDLKNSQEKLEKLEEVEKKLSDARKKLTNTRRTYIIGTVVLLGALLFYLYKTNELPDILSQLPDAVSNSLKKYFPAT